MPPKQLLAIALGIGVATASNAGDIPFDFTHCYSGTNQALSRTDAARVGWIETTGIVRSNGEAKTFDNATSHCIALYKVKNEEVSFLANCKMMTPDENWIVYEQVRTPESKTWDWSVIDAGGKWAGATGTGASTLITNAKPIKPGASAGCNTHVGKLVLP